MDRGPLFRHRDRRDGDPTLAFDALMLGRDLIDSPAGFLLAQAVELVPYTSSVSARDESLGHIAVAYGGMSNIGGDELSRQSIHAIKHPNEKAIALARIANITGTQELMWQAAKTARKVMPVNERIRVYASMGESGYPRGYSRARRIIRHNEWLDGPDDEWQTHQHYILGSYGFEPSLATADSLMSKLIPQQRAGIALDMASRGFMDPLDDLLDRTSDMKMFPDEPAQLVTAAALYVRRGSLVRGAMLLAPLMRNKRTLAAAQTGLEALRAVSPTGDISRVYVRKGKDGVARIVRRTIQQRDELFRGVAVKLLIDGLVDASPYVPD